MKDGKENYYESISFDMKKVWEVYVKSKTNNFFDTVAKFKKINGTLKFSILIASDDEKLNKIAKNLMSEQ